MILVCNVGNWDVHHGVEVVWGVGSCAASLGRMLGRFPTILPPFTPQLHHACKGLAKDRAPVSTSANLHSLQRLWPYFIG
jgi:hypothetical protein